ncbi:MAG: serine protease [Pseudomonadota bacterium]
MLRIGLVLAAFVGLSACAATGTGGDRGTAINAIEPEWDEFAAGELEPLPGENEEPVNFADIPIIHPDRPYPVFVRLSEKLDDEQRSLVEAAVAEIDGIAVHAPATYEVAPHPAFDEHLVFYRLKGAGGEDTSAIDPQMNREGVMTLEDILHFYEYRISNVKNAWASNVPVPVHLGRPDRDGFKDDLRSQIEPIVRRAALLAIGNSGSGYHSTSLCISEALSYGRSCLMPARKDWNTVHAGQGHYLSINAQLNRPHFITAISISPSGTVSHLLSQWAEFPQYVPGSYVPTEYVDEDGNRQRVTDAPASPQRLEGQLIGSVAGDREAGTQPIGETARYPTRMTTADHVITYAETRQPSAVFAEPGRHKVIVIATETPIDSAIWELELGDPTPPLLCEGAFEKSLCSALTGGPPGKSFDWAKNIQTFTVNARKPIVSDEYIINGFPAPASLAKWQAQLFVYRPGDQFHRSTSSPRANFEKAHKCGGSYIGGGYILTAAHCIRPTLSEMRVRLGTRDITSGGRSFRVHSAAIHKRGKGNSRRADIALIRISDPRGRLGDIRSTLAAVAVAGSRSYPDPDFNSLIVTGWGYMSAMSPGTRQPIAADGSVQRNPAKLRGLDLSAISATSCTNRSGFDVFSPSDILCARSKYPGGDACSGDSGGPVTSRIGNRRVLVGVVSVGIGCAQGDTPAVYMKVSRYADWIAKARRALKNAPRGSRLSL